MSALLMAVIAVVLFLALAFLVEFVNVLSRVGGEEDWRNIAGYALGNLVDDFYRYPRDALRAWRCERARRYLLKYDHSFRMQEAGLELVRRRNLFYEQGGSAASPECPDWNDVLKEL